VNLYSLFINDPSVTRGKELPAGLCTPSGLCLLSTEAYGLIAFLHEVLVNLFSILSCPNDMPEQQC
jgi:hypothetical protein